MNEVGGGEMCHSRKKLCRIIIHGVTSSYMVSHHHNMSKKLHVSLTLILTRALSLPQKEAARNLTLIPRPPAAASSSSVGEDAVIDENI